LTALHLLNAWLRVPPERASAIRARIGAAVLRPNPIHMEEKMNYKRILIALAIFLPGISAFANVYGAIRGVVHDPQHRPVQNAKVMLKAKSSDWAKTASTDANGEFQINAVPLGDYTVSVASVGFEQTA